MEKEEVDLGTLKGGEKTERRVSFRNGGDKPLRVEISAVRRAPTAVCGCAVESYTVEPAEVAPGGIGEMVFVISPAEGMGDMREDVLVDQRSDPPTVHVHAEDEDGLVPEERHHA